MNDVNLIDLKKNLIINLSNKSNMFYTSLQSLYEYVGRSVLDDHHDYNGAYQLTENVISFYKLDKKLLNQFDIVNKFSNQVKHRNPGQTGPKFDKSMASSMVYSYNDYIIELTKKGAIHNDFLLMLETFENGVILSDNGLKPAVSNFEDSEAYKKIEAKVDLLSQRVNSRDVESRNPEINVNHTREEDYEPANNDFDSTDERIVTHNEVDSLNKILASNYEETLTAKEKMSSFMNNKNLFHISIALLIIFAVGFLITFGRDTILNNIDTSQNSSNTVKTYGDGSTYKGQISNSLRNGTGLMTWPNRDSYNGEWKNDKQNGQGKLITAEYEYSGEFSFGKKEGYGKIQYKNGDTYEGSWENDTMHGKGDAKYADGTSYSGDFKYGFFDGFGTYYGEVEEGKFMVDGEFSNNATVVNGYMVFYNGNAYKGRFENYVLQGFGSFILSNGIVFSGNFIDFLLDGKATITLLDGLVVNVTYEKGEVVSEFTTVMQNGEIKEVVLNEGKGTIIN